MYVKSQSIYIDGLLTSFPRYISFAAPAFCSIAIVIVVVIIIVIVIIFYVFTFNV